jgi:hypothetical protein
MLVNYKQTLETARKYGVDAIMLTIAEEMQSVKLDLLNKTMSDNEFELCCSLVEDSYLKSDKITIPQFARALSDIIELEENENKSIEEIIKQTSTYELILKACWYEGWE